MGSPRRRVGVDETAIQIGRERFWLYAAIDLESKLLLGVRVSRWLTAFAFYYNFQRPNQALDNRTPVEEVTNA